MYCIIDVETTGNGVKGNKVTEIAIFKYDGNTLVDEFTSLVNPQAPIPHFITALTGIDDSMVATAPTFAELADSILNFTADCIFVAHSVNFDYGVIKEEFRLLGIDFVRKKLCTVRLSRKLLPGLRSYSLGKLCAAEDIPLTDRHRARGDAHATVLLFEKLLKQPGAKDLLTASLHARSQEATLPPHLNRTELLNLPNQPGIYYFLDSNHKIIYVGKANNLKKRVLGHFYDKSEHELKLCREVAHIDFELSGSELVALLMEAAAIKKHWPRFNRAQKRKPRQYGLFTYEDRRGVQHLGFGLLSKLQQPLATYNNPTDCRTVLTELCKAFDLCPKYCQLVAATFDCKTQASVFTCKGICTADEAIANYNKRVEQAIAVLEAASETVVFKEKGRHAQESAFVLIEAGIYRGYGFVPETAVITDPAELETYLIPQQNSPDIERILNSYKRKRLVLTTT